MAVLLISAFWVGISKFFSKTLREIYFPFILMWQQLLLYPNRIPETGASNENPFPTGTNMHQKAMKIRAEGQWACQTQANMLLEGAKLQSFFCPWFQLLLQMCGHFDVELGLDTRGSSAMQYRFSCPVLPEVTRTPGEETGDDISLVPFFAKSQCRYGTSLPDFCCAQLKHRVRRDYPSTTSGDNGTAKVNMVHLKIGCEVTTTLCIGFSPLCSRNSNLLWDPWFFWDKQAPWKLGGDS